MADEKKSRVEISDLKNGKGINVKINVDVDVSDALTALKAVQREARKATQALRELEKISEKIAAVNEPASDYMTGLYNGIELASAILESRDPEFKDLPNDR